MRILALVANDNTYQPRVYEEILKQLGSEMIGLVIVPMMPNLGKEIKFMRFLFNLYSFKGFFLKFSLVIRNKVYDILSCFFPLKRCYSLKRLAKKYSIPLYFTCNINSGDFLEFVSKLQPDLIISSQGQIIGSELLRIPRKGIINKHAGLLPKYRGIYPVFWAMMNNEKRIGITVHFVNEGIDAGDIIIQEALEIGSDDTFESIYERVIRKTPDLLLKAVDLIKKDGSVLKKNDTSEASYYSYPTKMDIARFKKLGKRVI